MDLKQIREQMSKGTFGKGVLGVSSTVMDPNTFEVKEVESSHSMAGAKIIRSANMVYKKGTSNKVYNIYARRTHGGEIQVYVEWGKANSSLIGNQVKIVGTLDESMKMFDKIVTQKIKKGYRIDQQWP